MEEERLSLADARELGRDRGPNDTGQDTIRATEVQDGGQGALRSASAGNADALPHTPPQPVSRISKGDTTQECWCGCGSRTSTNRRFRVGHDMKAKGTIKRAVREGKVEGLSPQLKEYAKERGLL